MDAQEVKDYLKNVIINLVKPEDQPSTEAGEKTPAETARETFHDVLAYKMRSRVSPPEVQSVPDNTDASVDLDPPPNE